MPVGLGTHDETRAPETYETRPLTALRRGLRWLVNPVSIGGVVALNHAQFAVAGPNVARKVHAMREHPDGSRVLRDRPDLGATLADLDAMAEMPDGSLGRAYHAFHSSPEAVPGYLLNGLLYRYGTFERLDWSDEMKFVHERMAGTHDLVHALSGYGTHLTTEAININFTIGIEDTDGKARPAAAAWSAASGAVLVPEPGLRRWHELMMEAYDRGRSAAETQPFFCIYFEELLPRPLDEVRSQLGIPELSDEFDSSAWIRNPVGRAMANGFAPKTDRSRKAEWIARIVQTVEAGADPKVLVNLRTADMAKVLWKLHREAPVDDVVESINAGRVKAA